ncbi:gliding motility-associated C-terminal domain-containing protein [Salinimicrobium soli]|uniref:T9SS type B sorting domain-containing protein n=1 Tax=Salinimicrobium soli TaxID=1254399 RepID=UPI003AAF7F82
MIWKTTLTKIYLPADKKEKNSFWSFLGKISAYPKLFLVVALFSVANLSAQNAGNNGNGINSIVSGDDCIVFDSCPEDQTVCADTTNELGEPGAYIDWTTPRISQTCTSTGSTGNFQMLFELNEALLGKDCWDFNYVQRVGTDGGYVRLFSSNDVLGNKKSIITTPFLALDHGSETSIELTYVNGTYYVQMFLVEQGKEPVSSGEPQLVTSGTNAYSFNIEEPTGVYRIQYVFYYTGSKPSNANIGDTVIAVDGILYDSGCSGGVDFTVTGPQKGFYPVGSHDLQYVANYTAPDGSTKQKTCSFNITVEAPVEAEAPANVEACDSYTLPALTNGAYFGQTGGVDPIAEGTEITATQTIYVYAAAQGSCEAAENSFTVTINNTPVADSPSNVEACDSYTLPSLTNGAYFGQTGGVDPIAAGTEITATQTIYVYTAAQGSCEDAENSFTVTINNTPVADAPSDVEACDSYTLPALTNGAYFAQTGGVDPIAAGTEISATQIIYVYTAGNGSCEDAENSFTVTINNTPVADAPSNVEACDSYTLPALTNGAYFGQTGGVDPIAAGTEITATQTIYVYTAGNGSCEDAENSFTVTINNTPVADAPSDVEACDSFTLPALTNGAYFAQTGGVDPIAAGTEITATQTIYVYTAGNGSCEDAENSFTVTINNTPVADAPSNVEACDSYTLPALTNGAYFAQTGGVDPIAAGTEISATQIIYVYTAGNGSCEDAENSFTVTINNTPLADAPSNVEACDSYTLPALTNGAYFGQTGGVDPIAAGTEITATQTIYVYTAAQGSCEDAENSFTVTINNTPVADAPSDVEACDSYTLPALTNGAYFGQTGGVDPIAAGTEITATQTIYVYTAGNGSCEDVENSFTVTINNTPVADAPSNVEACDSYTLPALTNGAYFAQTGGVDPIAAGTEITATQTIYVYTAGNGSCEDAENSFTVTINNTPVADAPSNVEACDSYTLPALTNGAYFASQGGVDPIAAGTEITATQTIYVFTAGNGSCEDAENSFTVTINNTPVADAPGNVEACDSYTLPALTNGGYYAQTGGVDPIAEGTEISSTQTIYVFNAGNGSCEDAENSFTVTINGTPFADNPSDVEACDSYILPALANGAYFSETGGNGTQFFAGDEITTTQMIYVYNAASGSCEAAENSFTVTINNTPVADAPSNVEACDSYTLPALTNGGYFASQGGVDPIAEGTEITATQTIYVYTAGNGSCEDAENSFTVTINNTPVADAPSNVEACDSYTLPALTNGAYFAQTGGVDPIAAGTEITATQTIYVFTAGTGSCEDAENSFTVTINNTPVADAPSDVEACDSYTLPELTNGAYFASQGGVDPIAAGTEITATQTIYVYTAAQGSCEDAENSFTVTINTTPVADAPGNVEACDSYTLPALTNGSYFASQGGVDPIAAGTEITATQTIYVYTAAQGSCVAAENSFTVTINNTPVADAPGNVEACDSYTLPALTNGAYFASQGGVDPIAAGTEITATQTIYVFTAGNGSCEDAENSFTVTINNTPVADAPSDVEACDSYTLPALTNGAYFGQTGGVDPIAAGTEITATQTIYVYTAGNGSCENAENSFTVTINNTPVADAPSDVEACDSYTLPALTNGAYFASQGGVDPIAAGTEITATQTIYVYTAGNGSCEDAENSFTVTINGTPFADNPSDVEACDSYILPALANGEYFSETDGNGTQFFAGDEITTTQMIYVYNAASGSCEAAENSFTVTINNTPVADAPSDVEACDSYTLPALTNGAYFASQGGDDPIAAGTEITATQMIYVFTAGNGSCEDAENSFTVTINNTPVADAPNNVEACESYTLPALTHGAYFGQTGGVDPIAEGTEITATQTIYVYTAGNGSCENAENSFTVTINNSPVADAPSNVEACDSYILPALTNGEYFASQGGVDPIAEGTEITATQTIYVYTAGNSSCEDVENSFTVTINNTPVADAPSNVEACDSYTLPALTNGAYFASQGGVDPIAAGTEITATQTIYVYTAGNGSCENAENSFTVTINNTPVADAPGNVEACDSYTLPALTNGAYFVQTGGVDPIAAGTEITATQTIYVYTEGNGSCEDVENSFTVTINNTPVADAPSNVEACDSYTLPALTNGAYFASQGGVDPIAAGTEITATQTIYVYTAAQGSCEDAENSFTVTINNTPVADAPSDVEACDSYTLPALTNGAYFASQGGVDPIAAGTEITATQTIYVYTAGNGSCEDAENSFTVTIESLSSPEFSSVEQPTCTVATGSFQITGFDASNTYNFTPGVVSISETGLVTANAGTYSFTITNAAGCTSPASDDVVINAQPETPAAPEIEELLQATCEDQTGFVMFKFVEGVSFVLTDENGNEITDTDADGIFEGLTPGTYTATATNTGGCTSEETEVVIDNPTPSTIETTTTDLCIEDSSYDLFNLLLGEYDENGTWEDAMNTGALTNSFVDPSLLQVGQYEFNYVVGNGECSSTTTVILSINDDCVVLPCGIEDIKGSISKAVTPNGDDINDSFEIGIGVDCGFAYTLKVFNRWGSKVYESKNYQSGDWDGTSSNSITGDRLPAGTYYYIVEIKQSGFAPIQGYIYLGTK